MGLQVEGGLMVHNRLGKLLISSWLCIHDWCWTLNDQEFLENGFSRGYAINRVVFRHARKQNEKAAKLLMILLNVLRKRR
jgi:hypothetical protein